MAFIQLPLPFAVTSKLNEEQKLSLITNQSKRLEISDIEIASLIEICQRKGFTNKGLAIIYKYTNYIEEILNCLSKLTLLTETFLKFDTSVYLDSVVDTLSMIVHVILNLLISLINWRKLQGIPRPISVEEGNTIYSLSEFILHRINVICHHLKIWHGLPELDCSELYLQVTLSLFQAAKSFTSDSLLSLYHTKRRQQTLTKIIETLLQSINNPSQLPDSKDFSQLLLNVLFIEDLINHKWTTNSQSAASSSGEGGTKNSPNITLFIPYHGFKQYIPQMKWFFHLFPLYDKYLEILNSNIDCFKNHPSTFIENLQSKGKVIILSVCPILIKSITSLDMIHMHYSPYGTNNLQLQTPSTMPILPSPLEPISEHRDSGITQIVEFNQIRRPVNFRSRSNGQPEEKIIRPQSFDTLESESSAPYEPLYDFNDVGKSDPKINDTLLKPISPIEIESKERPPISPIQRETPVSNHRDSEDIQITYIDSPEVDNSNFSSPVIKEQHYYMNLRSRVKSADEISTDFQHSPILPYRPRMLSDPITTTTKKKLYSKKKNFRNPLISYRAVDVSSTSLFLALSLIDVTNKSIEEIAVRKIEIWYMIMAPRRKLSKRLMMRSCIVDAIDFIIDRTMQLAINRRRRRKYLMRQGAAMKIQRFYRVWVHSVLQEEKRLENEEKIKFVNFHLNLWYRAIMASIRIYRFLRNCMKNKIIRRSIYFQDLIREEEAQKALSPLFHPVLMIPQFIPSNKMRRQRTSFQTIKLKTILQNYMILLSFYRKIELQQQIITRFDSKLQTTGTPTQLFKKTHNRRLQMFKQMENAVVLIQSIYRTFLTRRLFKERLKYNRMSMKIAMFMIRYISWRRSTRKTKLNKCAITIQKFFRGLHIRYRIFRLVQAGLKLNTFWRKHLAHSRLRSQLRRVDKPYTVVVHGIRNLPKKFVNSESVRFQLSVWWNPLLHIVGRNDFNVILHSKQPQYIYLSDYHKVVEQIIEDDEDNTESSENKGTIASLLPLASRARLSIFGGRARSPSKYISSSMSSSTVNNTVNKSATASSPVLSPSKLQLPEISSSSKNKPSENFVNNDQETESFRNKAVEKGQNALKSRLMAIRMNNSLKNSSSGKIEESGDSLRSNSQKSDPVPPPPRITTPPRISNDRLRRLREIAIQNEKDDSDDSLNENSDDERRDSFDVTHELPPRNASKKLLPNASDRQLSKNVMDSDQSSDSDKDSQVNEQNSPTDKKTPNINVIRKGLNFAMKLGSIVQNKKGSAPKPQPNLVCIFEDETIKIPGCHGNSVFKFEILDGDRKVAHSFFYLGREGDLMFWGGEYHREITTNQNRRQHQLANISNSKALNKNVTGQAIMDSPVLDFRIIAGAPLRSRCQWARLFVKGNGPLKRAIQGHNMFGSFGSFSLFGNWHRYYLSLDEFGLSLFNNKFNSQPFFTIPVKELKRVYMDMGAPIGVLNNTSKNVVEDIINVILTTTTGDELFIRFPDSGSRISWIEVLTNTIKYNHGSHISNVQNKNWLTSTILGTKKSSPSKSSKYTQPNLTKVTEEEQEAKNSDDSESDDEDEDKEADAFQPNRSPHSPYKPGSMLVLRSNSQNFVNNKIQTPTNVPNSPHHNTRTVQGIRSRIQPLLSTFSPSIGKRKTMTPANISS